MKSSEYWLKRSEQVASRQFAKADKYAASLGSEYGRAMQDIQRSIEVFYQRYSLNGEVSMTEARKRLSGKEMDEFKMTLEEFTAKAKNNADGRWTQQLNAVYYRTRVSRYEALQLQIRQQVEMMAGNRQQGVRKILGDMYADTYYRTLFEIQKGTGLGASFARIDSDGLERVLKTEFAGSNWSKRIWGDRDKLAGELRTKLAQSFIRGDRIDRTVKDLSERLGVSRSNAERLVQTESAFFVGEATAAGYEASGVVDQYEILATLDNRTSAICQSMDSRVFDLSAREVNINYPPFHARCRTTVTPYFDDEVDIGERISRDEDGSSYYVPGDINYPDWKKKFVNSPSLPESAIINTNHKLIYDIKNSYDNWDKQNVKEFAQNLLHLTGLNLTVQRHKLSANGQCQLDPSGNTLKVNTYELNSNDARDMRYQVKTAFHELFHAKVHGLPHDIHGIGFKTWSHYDDVFAESFAHYMTKSAGIVDEISPSYPGHLIETLPKLKTLPEFKQAKTISDFGEIAFEYRLGSKLNAEWDELNQSLNKKQFDISTYSKSYIGYMAQHSDELIDKMLENMPSYKAYRSQMHDDLMAAIKSEAKNLTGNEKIVFENILILAMNRKGVNEL